MSNVATEKRPVADSAPLPPVSLKQARLPRWSPPVFALAALAAGAGRVSSMTWLMRWPPSTPCGGR